MKFEVTLEELEEYACCIVDCNLDRDEAYQYIKACVTNDDSYDPDEKKKPYLESVELTKVF